MMSTKLATPGLLKIKVFWNKSCDVLIFVHMSAIKFYRVTEIIAEVVMWPKFDNSSISMREVIVTSIL